ncbi:phage late control D family protein [Palleronia sp.]|uniref:phage late control D family protein n=1 Tax=Palleronia sp. TaxID=1940284 RepID=UPI0035C873F8
MTPNVRIVVDGREVDFRSALQSCEIVDKEGVSSDTINLVIANPDQAIPLPPKGARIEAWISGDYFGSYTAETVSAPCFPHMIEVTGKAAGFKGKEKEPRDRHWDDASLTDIVTDLAGALGMPASVDPEIGAHVYDWIGQVGESPVAFLERLARRHDALFSIKDGRLIFAARGAGRSPSGAELTAATITPAVIVPGTCRFEFSDRSQYAEVAATYTDRAAGERKDVTVPSDGDGIAVWRIGEQFADEAEAKKAATAKAKDMRRRQSTFSVEVVGDTAFRAGAPVRFSGVLREIDGKPFIVETATHTVSKAGYRARLDGHAQV